jgi:hypothetical protein
MFTPFLFNSPHGFGSSNGRIIRKNVQRLTKKKKQQAEENGRRFL